MSARVAGIRRTPLVTPRAAKRYEDLAAAAIRESLEYPGVELEAVERAFTCCVLGASACGQAALYRVGLGEIPVTNAKGTARAVPPRLNTRGPSLAAGAVRELQLGRRQYLPVASSRIPPPAIQGGPPLGANGRGSARNSTEWLASQERARPVVGARLAVQHEPGPDMASAVIICNTLDTGLAHD